MVDLIYNTGFQLSTHFFWVTYAWPVLWTLMKIVAVLLPLLLCVAYLTLWERKAIGYTQIRKGPNRTGPGGMLQPIADALKLMTKEIIIPAKATTGLFLLGPIMTIMPALAAWAVVPFWHHSLGSEAPDIGGKRRSSETSLENTLCPPNTPRKCPPQGHGKQLAMRLLIASPGPLNRVSECCLAL